MAGAGAKARIANNRAIVRRTRGAAYAAAAVCALFIALRAGAFRYQSTAAAVAKLLVSGAVEAAALWRAHAHAYAHTHARTEIQRYPRCLAGSTPAIPAEGACHGAQRLNS